MLKSAIIRIKLDPNGEYEGIIVCDGINKETHFNSGHIEVDYAIAYYVAKHHFQVINIHESIDKFIEENNEYSWVHSPYGEFVLKVFDKEIV